MRKAYELAIANSWNEIRCAANEALAGQLPKPMSKKILLVDDECSILEALSKVLGAENYEVTLAENGEDAVALIAAEPIDLVLLDIGLPVKNGGQLSSGWQRSIPCCPSSSLPVARSNAH